MDRNCWITVSTRENGQSVTSCRSEKAESSASIGASIGAPIGIAVTVLSMGFFLSYINGKVVDWHSPDWWEENAELLKWGAGLIAMVLGFLSMGVCSMCASLLSLSFCVYHGDNFVASEERDRYAFVSFEKEGDTYTVKWDDHSMDLKLSQGRYYVIRKDGSEWKCDEYLYRY